MIKYFAVLITAALLLCSCSSLKEEETSKAVMETSASVESAQESLKAPPEKPAIYETPSFSLPVDMEPEEKIYALTLSSPYGPFIYYNQCDSRWADYLYGGSDPMRRYGCGPTVLAMFASSFTSTPMSPPEAADWAAENKFWVPKQGSLHSIIPDGLTGLGLRVESVSPSVENLKECLNAGKLLVTLMGQGTFTRLGHFLIITELHEDGTVSIADPASYDNTLLSWNPETIINELKRGGGDGGPLWAVSVPNTQ